MRLGDDGFFGLTYCTNIHPAQGWSAVFSSLERYAPALKARLSPDAPFGIGLRLSGAESVELLEGSRLQDFASWLRAQGLYVFSLNGFPYGAFHGTPVKADVHAPDWRNEERVQYTLRLVRILEALLPEGLDGSISTSPLSYKSWIDQNDRATWQLLARNVARIAEALEGTAIHLDLEPEPDGLIERSTELVQFFETWLPKQAWDHVGVCFDTCHMAVAHEDPAEVMERFSDAGIRIGKIQVSSALEVPLPARRESLQPFADAVYLHQVTQRNVDGNLRFFPDLPEALDHLDDPRAREWRIHFHTPLFIDRYATFRSTREWIERTFDEVKRRHNCRILEIETYTWDVLPPELKQDLTESIAREYAWVLSTLALPTPAGHR
jgi:sugar phosphate isomerase/epimerase